jgi:hypothetical protein
MVRHGCCWGSQCWLANDVRRIAGARPVAGKYSLNISVIDSANLKAQTTMPITVQ